MSKGQTVSNDDSASDSPASGDAESSEPVSHERTTDDLSDEVEAEAEALADEMDDSAGEDADRADGASQSSRPSPTRGLHPVPSGWLRGGPRRRREGEYDTKYTYTHNRETPTATEIGDEDERGDEAEHLRDIERRTNDRLSTHKHELDKKRITEAYCDSLEVTPYQRQEAVRLMEFLDLEAFGSQRAVPGVALAVIKYVVTRDRMENYGADATRISEDDTFQQLVEEEGLDMGDIMSISQTMKEQLRNRRESGSDTE